jgi:sortase (surface protein transpeptidase)
VLLLAFVLIASRGVAALAGSTQADASELDGASAPSSITIPAIDIEAEVVPVVSEDGVLGVPEEPWVAGWWQDGASPGGAEGAVLLDAHVDSIAFGPGPFSRVTELEPGDLATITVADGSAFTYRVQDVTSYTKADLPYEQLFSQAGPERLVFVTCGGRYLGPDEGGYESNVVVVFVPA